MLFRIQILAVLQHMALEFFIDLFHPFFYDSYISVIDIVLRLWVKKVLDHVLRS
jgi:hypothetical protein